MRIGNIILLICIVLGVMFLSGLGFWQLNRLQQKEAMIARVETNLKSAKLSIAKVEAMLGNGDDIEYQPTKVSGKFDHSKEQHYFATHKGKSGYFVYTPLVRKNGKIVFVNRGFVPHDLKEPSERSEGLVQGDVELSGLARSAPSVRPNSFVPDNDLAKNIYYWKSLSAMTQSAYGTTSATITPFFVDADDAQNPGDWPVGGVTRIEFPNSHLQYALTWFGLAGALLAVGGYFLWGRMRRSPTPY